MLILLKKFLLSSVLSVSNNLVAGGGSFLYVDEKAVSVKCNVAKLLYSKVQ